LARRRAEGEGGKRASRTPKNTSFPDNGFYAPALRQEERDRLPLARQLEGLDAMHQFLGLSPRLPHVGEVLTGLVLGRGSNYVHDLYARYIQPEAGAKA